MLRRMEIPAHAYMSVCPDLDAALGRFHVASGPKEGPFRNLMMTLVDATCRGVSLYAPNDFDPRTGEAEPTLYFERRDIRVYALYTDETRADACAELCATKPMWGTRDLSLASVLSKENVALALNMGLPDQAIFPPEAVRTLWQLCRLHQNGQADPVGPAWADWTAAMESWYERRARRAEAQSSLPAGLLQLVGGQGNGVTPRELQAAAAEMMIAVCDEGTLPGGNVQKIRLGVA